MSMSRRTRKQLIGKTENYEERMRVRSLKNLRRELRRLWRSQADDPTLILM